MICPYCGKVDRKIPTPDLARTNTLLGKCNGCGREVWALPTTRRREDSPLSTVAEGEEREELLVKAYLKREKGDRSRKRESADDIDREILDGNDRIVYFLEVKERSCSLNAYRKTKFPYAKIDSAKRLIRETGVPVVIVLKFVDCWGRFFVNPDFEYEKGNEPFAPRYRPSQRTKERQVPVLIDVESLEIMTWRDCCEEIKS